MSAIDAGSSKHIVNAGIPAELGCLFAYLNRCLLPAEQRQQLKEAFLSASKTAADAAPIPRLREFFLEGLSPAELDFLERCRINLAQHFEIRF
ncbi:MAG: hypothetical protein IPJ21_11190 [Sterolibacteriaceae bacterium]|nr:hypothetical protein [Sterolibacteriaceae bacterium]MBK9084421.1 hypothetical protein [Sterolibacteriaceae bacterium]